MNVDKSSKIVIQKMLKEISIVNDITMRYTKENFLNDNIAQRAAAMTIINIGELAGVFFGRFSAKLSANTLAKNKRFEEHNCP